MEACLGEIVRNCLFFGVNNSFFEAYLKLKAFDCAMVDLNVILVSISVNFNGLGVRLLSN